MRKNLFPKEFIEQSIENYTFKIKATSNGIYLLLIISFTIAFISIFIIQVEVSTSARGQIASVEQKITIQSPVTARVLSHSLKENIAVSIGDTLLRFDESMISNEINLLNRRRDVLRTYITDIKELIHFDAQSKRLINRRYQLEQAEFSLHLEKLTFLEKNAQKIFDRQLSLFSQKVIAEKEFEMDELAYEKARVEKQFFINQKKTLWQQEILNFENELQEIKLKTNQLQDQMKNHVVLAPSSGSILNTIGIEKGQILHTGAKVADISPGDSLIATCSISPSDIGLLYKGQHGSFRIDAFNYNEWGLLKGVITEISKDVYFNELGLPYFTIKCRLSNDHLKLKNGFIGRLKKGMTIQANFQITRRTLYQLIYDKTDNWMNPQSPRLATKEDTK